MGFTDIFSKIHDDEYLLAKNQHLLAKNQQFGGEILALSCFSDSIQILRAWTNEKCLGAKHHQTLFGDQT